MKRKKENESGFLKKRLREVAVEIGNEKKIPGYVSQGKDEIRTRFGAQVEKPIEKEVIVEEQYLEVVKRTELESEVSQLGETVLSLQKEEKRLRGSNIVLEKECGEGVEKEKETDLNQVMKQLGGQKKIVEAMSREKIEVEKAKGNGEKEIVELIKELGKFKNNILSLEESCKVQIGRTKELESEVNQYRDEFDCVKIERDEAKEGFK
ncbi:hypothetical protein LguiA_034768 [Lonicera macranthoides]